MPGIRLATLVRRLRRDTAADGAGVSAAEDARSGSTLAMTHAQSPGEVRLIDAATGKPRATLGPFKRPIKAFTFSPDGKLAAAATGLTGVGGRRPGATGSPPRRKWSSGTPPPARKSPGSWIG